MSILKLKRLAFVLRKMVKLKSSPEPCPRPRDLLLQRSPVPVSLELIVMPRDLCTLHLDCKTLEDNFFLGISFLIICCVTTFNNNYLFIFYFLKKELGPYCVCNE